MEYYSKNLSHSNSILMGLKLVMFKTSIQRNYFVQTIWVLSKKNYHDETYSQIMSHVMMKCNPVIFVKI